MAHRDRAAVPVDPGIVVGNPEVVQEAQDLHGKSLVDFEEADVVDAESGVLQGLLGGRHGADAHHFRFDAGIGVADQPHLDGQAELRGRF